MSLTQLLGLVAFLLPLGFAFQASSGWEPFAVLSWLAVGGMLGLWGFAVVVVFAFWSLRWAKGPSGSKALVRWTLALLGPAHLAVVGLLAVWAQTIMRLLAPLPPGTMFENALKIVFPYALLMGGAVVLSLSREGSGVRRAVRRACGGGMFAVALLLLFFQYLALRDGTLIVMGTP